MEQQIDTERWCIYPFRSVMPFLAVDGQVMA